MRNLVFIVLMILAVPAVAGEPVLLSESGRSVFRRGEPVDLALRLQVPQDVTEADVEFWAEETLFRMKIGAGRLTGLQPGQADSTYRIDTARLHPGTYRLIARAAFGEQKQEAAIPIEITRDTRLTDFIILHMGIPGWVLPTGNLYDDSRRYRFNFSMANVCDSWNRGNAGVGLAGHELSVESMLRNGIDFMKYPTGYGWGLAHRPIRRGASWYDPDIIEISAQLMQYHAQGVRRFPNCIGLNPIDEPGVSWTDPHMAAAFKQQTGLDAPLREDRLNDPDRYVAWQIFRNHALNDFNTIMRDKMREVNPDALMSCQTFAGILTDGGLYPGGNTFLDVQSTHTYDHWPTSNNWISFALNLRRANRNVFWKRPLITFTGCYGIMEDQWRAAWALGMGAKLDGHGYFLGAGELPENQPWAEFSLAEMVRINRLCEQYGDFFRALEKPVEPLALWYSLSQSAAADPARNYEQEVVGAFFALKRSHFPVTIITDEDIRAGLLKEHKVLMLVGMDYVPQDLGTAIEKWGGKLVADRTTTAFTGAGDRRVARIDADFREFAACWAEVGRAWNEKRQPVSMLLRRDLTAEAGILRDLPKIQAALLPLVDRPAWAGSPFTFIDVQNSGDARFVFVANDASVIQHTNETARWITMQESVPAVDTITIPGSRGKAVYDLWTSERLEPDKADSLTLRLQPGGLRVLCVYPKALRKPEVEFYLQESQSGMRSLAADCNFHVNTFLAPSYLQVTDPQGCTIVSAYISGYASRKYMIASNDPSGRYEARLTNLLTGGTSIESVNVDKTDTYLGPIVRELPPAISFDDRAYADFAKRKPIYVVPGEACEAEAAGIAKILAAEIRKPDDVRKGDTYPELLDPEKNKGVWMMPRWQPLALTAGADLVLVGSPDNNILIKDINQSGMLRRVIHPSTLGTGEGMVQYCWSPFDLDKDAAVIAGYDAAGLRAACERFLAAAKLTPGTDAPNAVALKSDFQREDVAAPPAANAPETITPSARIKLADGVRKLAAGGGIVAMAGQDSRLSVFDDSGKLLWQRDLAYRAIGVDVSRDGQFIAVAAYPRACVFDRQGTLAFFSHSDWPTQDDVEGLAVLPSQPGRGGPGRGGLRESSAVVSDRTNPPALPAEPAPSIRLVKGTWSGKLQAYDQDGKNLWTFPPPPVEQKDKPADEPAPPAQTAPPEPFGAVRAIAPLPDGSFAVAGMQALLILDKDGTETLRKKIDRLQDVCPAGDNVLAASFKKKLMLLNRAGEPVWEKDVPDFIMAADATADGSAIAVALFGGEVMIFDAQGNVTRRARIFPEATLTGIAFDEAGDSLWLSTWEGEAVKWDF
ncbi:MAG TPA: PQQ-binding-like beta-propeller repeat protein [Planctomycetota bacterium]|nr:PQQ-binding-like beta-propeller repeat protein [Planctomycetota bacterium]